MSPNLKSKILVEQEPVQRGITWILRLGRLLGILPLSNTFRPKAHLEFRWRSFPTAHILVLTLIASGVLLPAIFKWIKGVGTYGTVLGELSGMEKVGYGSSVLFVYVYFTKNSSKLIFILNQWTQTMKVINLPTEDSSFPRFCILITTLVLGVGITENILSGHTARQNDGFLKDKSFLEASFLVGGKDFLQFIPYHPILSCILVYSSKMGTYSWNFGDIFLVILCRAISHKFKELNEYISYQLQLHPTTTTTTTPSTFQKSFYLPCTIVEEKRLSTSAAKEGSSMPPFQVNLIQSMCDSCRRKDNLWNNIRNKVMTLCDLTHAVTTFVAPLAVVCYCCNVYLMILQTLKFLNGIKTTDQSLYVYISTIQFTMRVVLVTYYAAQVYHAPEIITSTLEKCSDAHFPETAARLQRLLERHPVGVTIFGAVKITKKFFISILSFFFTTEIVLMQAMSATGGGGANKV